jgi:hypothetical protein
MWSARYCCQTIMKLEFSRQILLLLLLSFTTHLRVLASSFLRFLDHTEWHNTVGRTPLDEWPARRRDLSTWQHTQHSHIHAPGGIFYSLYFTCTTALSWLSWRCLLSVLCNTHNTNIRAPGWIRTRNPCRRAAADPRLRPLGHWDRLSWQLTTINLIVISVL